MALMNKELLHAFQKELLESAAAAETFTTQISSLGKAMTNTVPPGIRGSSPTGIWFDELEAIEESVTWLMADGQVVAPAR